MTFTQLIPFNTSTGGHVPDLCLDNVRRGYGINNKYGSAWEAWKHTQQHPDRNIPDGLDVPLYYSYTTTLNGVTTNYGHINVRLKNGSVWSDGNIYASIDAYMSNHYPVFVGWGESVNDFKIIGGDMEPIFNEGDRVNINKWLYGEDRLLYPAAIGMKYKDAIGAIFTSKEYAANQNIQYKPFTEALYVKA